MKFTDQISVEYPPEKVFDWFSQARAYRPIDYG